MTLDQLQPFIARTLREAPTLAGVPVLEDDGTFPKTPERERHLREKGLVLIVGQIESEGLSESPLSGVCPHDIYVPVVIEENVKVCRSSAGLKIASAKALQEVLAAVTAQPRLSPNNRRFMPFNPPFINVGSVNGVHRIIAQFAYQAVIQPTQ